MHFFFLPEITLCYYCYYYIFVFLRVFTDYSKASSRFSHLYKLSEAVLSTTSIRRDILFPLFTRIALEKEIRKISREIHSFFQKRNKQRNRDARTSTDKREKSVSLSNRLERYFSYFFLSSLPSSSFLFFLFEISAYLSSSSCLFSRERIHSRCIAT